MAKPFCKSRSSPVPTQPALLSQSHLSRILATSSLLEPHGQHSQSSTLPSLKFTASARQRCAPRAAVAPRPCLPVRFLIRAGFVSFPLPAEPGPEECCRTSSVPESRTPRWPVTAGCPSRRPLSTCRSSRSSSRTASSRPSRTAPPTPRPPLHPTRARTPPHERATSASGQNSNTATTAPS